MGRPFNAEEAVLPLRTVAIIIAILVGTMGLFWTARGQWDDTQTAIKDTQTAIKGVQTTADKTAKDQADFRAYIADLIVKKGGERDAQFAKVNATLTNLGNSLDSSVVDLNAKVADLNAKIAALRANQDGSHDETVKAITEIKLQIENIVKDMSVMKCKLPGNDCAKIKP